MGPLVAHLRVIFAEQLSLHVQRILLNVTRRRILRRIAVPECRRSQQRIGVLRETSRQRAAVLTLPDWKNGAEKMLRPSKR